MLSVSDLATKEGRRSALKLHYVGSRAPAHVGIGPEPPVFTVECLLGSTAQSVARDVAVATGAAQFVDHGHGF